MSAILVVVFCYIILGRSALGFTTKAPEDVHTFVALLDIVFRDGLKQTCTGTIVHDRVVLTAAHCFGSAFNAKGPELTTSFVVIGTKKMFDSSYELYMAIERIMRHPAYDDGEIADIALVYTFAGMTSGRPGRILPVSTDPQISSTDINVVVLSWADDKNILDKDQNSCSDEDFLRQGKNTEQKSPSEAIKVTHREVTYKTTQSTVKLSNTKREKVTSIVGVKRLASAPSGNSDKLPYQSISLDVSEDESTDSSEADEESESGDDFAPSTHMTAVKKFKWVTDTESQYRKPILRAEKVTRLQDNTVHSKSGAARKIPVASYTINRQFENKNSKKEDDSHTPSPYIFNNWRRFFGSGINKLSVANFTFLSGYACKKGFDEYKGSDNIKNEEIVCYTTDDREMILNAGAPIIRGGQLVAVTIGAIRMGKIKVAYGIKMACFCSWIKKLLPPTQDQSGNANLACCDKCCDPNILELTRNRYMQYG